LDRLTRFGFGHFDIEPSELSDPCITLCLPAPRLTRNDPAATQVGGRWFVDETYVKVAGAWRYVYRAVDEHGQVIDVFVSPRRNIAAARRFFTAALTGHGEPDEVVTDLAQALEPDR